MVKLFENLSFCQRRSRMMINMINNQKHRSERKTWSQYSYTGLWVQNLNMYICIYIYICVCMYVSDVLDGHHANKRNHIYIYIYIYIYKHMNAQSFYEIVHLHLPDSSAKYSFRATKAIKCIHTHIYIYIYMLSHSMKSCIYISLTSLTSIAFVQPKQLNVYTHTYIYIYTCSVIL